VRARVREGWREGVREGGREGGRGRERSTEGVTQVALSECIGVGVFKEAGGNVSYDCLFSYTSRNAALCRRRSA
jgi:hypothetical protein